MTCPRNAAITPQVRTHLPPRSSVPRLPRPDRAAVVELFPTGVAGAHQARAGSLVTARANPGLELQPPGAQGVGASGAALARTPRTSAQEPIPPGYRVPEGLEPSQLSTPGERVLAGLAVVAIAPLYLLVSLVALIPSLIGGAIEGPKADRPDGSGTFMAGFARVFRAMLGWLNRPLYGQLETLFAPRKKFFIDTVTDPGTTIITVRIRLEGERAHVDQIRDLERAIERRLAIPHYRVNVEFVDRDGADVTTIPIVDDQWSNSGAWNPFTGDGEINEWDTRMIAHELMHNPLGLPDEYDYQTHFTNENMGFGQRLGVFLHHLVSPDRPADADGGIMGNSSRPPHERHYQAILEAAA